MVLPASEAAAPPSGVRLRLRLLVLLAELPALVVGAILAIRGRNTGTGLVALAVVGILVLVPAWILGSVFVLRPVGSWMQRERGLRERPERIDRMRADLLSTVSHELRNPLATIRGFGQLLRDRPGSFTGEQEQQAYDAIVRQSDRMASILENVLDVSRLESDDFSYAFFEFQPARLLEECAQEARASWPGHDIAVETSGELPGATGDADRLKQVIMILLSNACRFSVEGTTVTVRARSDDATLRIDVADRGPGITPENAARLFRSAHQRTPDTKNARGTGLGLYISRRIVEAHGGRIWVESEPGNGATFSIEVPLNPPPPGA